MEKFRVRLKSGRVVGPFSAGQVLEMRDKGHVKGQEECQVFPAGDWLALSQFEFWQQQSAGTQISEGTFVLDLGEKLQEVKTQADAAESESYPEHDEDGVVLTPEEEPEDLTLSEENRQAFVEFDYRVAMKNRTRTGVSKADIEALKVELETRSRKVVDPEAKTLVRPSVLKPVSQEIVEHTVLSPSAKEWKRQLEEEKRLREEEEKRLRQLEETKSEEDSEPTVVINYSNEATQAISIAEIRNRVAQDAEKGESDLLRREERLEEERRAQEEEEELRWRQEDEARLAEEEKLQGAHRRKQIVLISLLVLVIMAVLFPDEPPKKKSLVITPINPELSFPVPFNTKDKPKSDRLYQAALERLSQGGFKLRVQAAKELKAAYENDIDNKAALKRLIRVYGELLPHSDEILQDGNVLFKLIQSNRLLQDVDPDVALGAGLFYRTLGKDEASLDVMDRFVKSQTNRPTRELFAAYLIALSDRNMETRADEVATSLLKTEKRGVEVNLALLHYYRYKNYPEKARQVLAQALQEQPESVPLMIAQGEYYLEDNNLKGLQEIAKKIREKGADSSRVYYGNLLEFEGFLLAFQNRPAEASKKFEEALELSDSESLRDRLTNIKVDPGASSEAALLIKQVKARELVREAQKATEKYDFQTALFKSLEAQGLNSGYIKADLALAAIQLRLGMTQEALRTLEDLHKSKGENPEVNFALLRGYIDNFKFTDAKRMLAIMAASDQREDWRYSSLNSEMYEKLGDLNQSILWLQKAINQNPIEDYNMYKLATLFTRAKKFPQARNSLFKAMDLNPVNIEYKLAYASIIYETEGVDAAIDYLFSLLKQFPDNPSITGDIAIYYHRAGRNKQFLATKRQIEESPVRDPRVYRFLIKAAIADESFDDAINYTEEYIKLEPGDLSAMMDMGKMLMRLKRYKEAARWFVRVREKLPHYPKVGYYKAKIELYVNNPDQAIADVREDMRVNGDYEEGLNLLGDILFVKGDSIGAEAEYKKSLRINMRSYGALRGLGDIAFKRGQMDIAIDLYKRAVVETQGVADDPSIHRKMGDVYRLMGQGALAIDSYQVYLKLVPEAPEKAQLEEHIRILE